MVGTRNLSMETHVDDSIKNWETDHVTQVTNEFIQKFDTVNTTLNDILSQMYFLMFRVKQFFAIDNVHEEDKVKIMPIHLYDRALAWHLQFIKAHGNIVVWNVYEEGILKRFGSVNEDPMAELKNLKYGNNMKEYQSQFEQLLTQVDITES
ncbi:putative mitochondrial protein [Tanacetum coccineum]